MTLAAGINELPHELKDCLIAGDVHFAKWIMACPSESMLEISSQILNLSDLLISFAVKNPGFPAFTELYRFRLIIVDG